MGSRRFRLTSMFVALAAALAVLGLAAPGAFAEVGVHVTIVNQPTPAGVDQLITASGYDPTGGDAGFVQVQVTETVLVPDIEGEGFHEETGPVVGAEVTFELAVGTGLATTDELNVESRFTNSDGIATFGPEEGSDNPLSIGDANQPFTTDYRLIPVATPPGEEATSVEGDPSDGFDIWEAGCHGAGCEVEVRSGNESYTAGEDVGMGASVVPSGSSEISCAGQRISSRAASSSTPPPETAPTPSSWRRTSRVRT